MNKNSTRVNCSKRQSLLYLLLTFITFWSCTEQRETRRVEPSFYYWKSVVRITSFELNRLNSLRVKTIYLKFFDVDYSDATGTPVPKAKLDVRDKSLLSDYQIIPTIFITNECFQKIDSPGIIILADKIYRLIKDLSKTTGTRTFNEIQIDCDWTASTSKNYFILLRYIKLLSKVNISATIRLHQVKYFNKTGVPPVDRGLLMCYNMGNLKKPATTNSILETSELKKYTGNLSSYPLTLDVALPLFEWKVLFRHNIYKGLIKNIQADIFTASFSRKNEHRIEILKDTILSGYDLKKGDMIRNEESNIAEIMATAEEISKHLKNSHLRVSLYHLDSVTLNKFKTNELENIYRIFH